MSSMVRRFEVLLPLRFNDGTPVPVTAIADTLVEFEEQFGAVSCESQSIRGRWRADGQSYRDDLIRVFVDVPDPLESREFFLSAKERLKTRFQQLDMLDDHLPHRSALRAKCGLSPRSPALPGNEKR